MASKNKYRILNMQQRMDVLKDLQEGKFKDFQIGKKYGISVKTVQRIKTNASKINAFADKSKTEKKRQRIRDPVYDELDKQLLQWFIQRRTLNDRLTDALLMKKALTIKENIPSCANAKVSRGWLSKFKKRNGIRLVNIFSKKASADQDAVQTFINNFNKMVSNENINLENIYNMDESGLVWKALPTITLAGEQEVSVLGYKMHEDRITVGFCANVSGTHKLMPFVIYKYKNPRALKHEVTIPVIFKSQKNAWMDRALFLDWFENYFKPSVKKYRERKNLSGKVILLLDNCEAHKISEQMEIDEDFKIIYLPPNMTSIIQPMDQGIIEKIKRLFRHKLLQCVLTYEDGINEFYKYYTIKDCIYMLAASWSDITEINIRNAWNKIIGPATSTNHSEITEELQPCWEEMLSSLTGQECNAENVNAFLTACEEADRRSEKEEIEGIKGIKTEEPTENYIFPENNDENVLNELRSIFTRLMFYSERAPDYIQYMVQGLKMFFLE